MTHSSITRPFAASVLLSSIAAIGCGGTMSGSASGAFGASYADNQAATLERALRQIGDHAGHGNPETAVAVAADGRHIIGFDATTGAVRYRVDATTTMPVIATGDYALVEEDRVVRVLDLATGRERLRVALGSDVTPQHMIGADADGSTLAISLSTATGSTARSRLVIIHGSSIDSDIALDRPLGVPAVAGSAILVPWAYQYLSVLHGDGHEASRVRVRNGVLGHAIAANGAVFFGGPHLHRLGVASANESPAGYEAPNLGIDRPPLLLPSAYDPPPALGSATHHVKLVFAVDPSRNDSPPMPADGLLYLVYYRFVFALDARDGLPRWVRPLPADVIGASAFPGGLRIAAESGEVLTLAASDGRAHASASIGEPVSFVAYPRLAEHALGEAVEPAAPDVRVQLMNAVQLPDARLVTAREFALARLAALTDDDATADLTVLCEDTRLPPRTKQRACDLLASRPMGSEHIAAQLRRHGSFLDETVAPPVATLARAAGNMRDATSVPLLVEQLHDPRTPVTAIAPIADALVAIGDSSAAPGLLAFLRTYHADTGELGMTDALGSIANAYARLGGPEALVELEALSNDNLAPVPVCRAMRDAATRVRADRANPSTTAVAQVATPAATAAPLPTHLSIELATPVLDGAHEDLVRCLRADETRPNSVRVIIVARRDGTVAEVLTSPDTAAACLGEVIMPLHFPATRGTGTARLTFTVRVR